MYVNSNIIIMGPIGVGKSSVSKKLAKRLGKPRIELDEQRERIYALSDYSNQEAERQYELHGILGWYRYQKPYELLSAKRILEEASGAVIDFGGGQSVYEEKEQIDEFLRLMEPVTYSFLLMPYQSDYDSLAFLKRRINKDEAKLNELFVPAESTRRAAKYIIYTGTKTVNQIVDEIIGYLN